MLQTARNAMLLACFALTGMMATMLLVSDGPAAIAAIAGTPGLKASQESLRLALALDFLLPTGYGAGFVLFALGLARTESQRPLAYAIVAFTLAGATMDFIENGMTIAQGHSNAAPFIYASVGKFGLLAIAAFLISSLLSPGLPGTKFAVFVFRYATPFALAFLLSGAAGTYSVWLFAPGLFFTFSFAAWIAHCEHERANT